MVQRGLKPVITSYRILLHGYATNGPLVDMHGFLDVMVRDGISLDLRVFNILVHEALLIFAKMRQHGRSLNVVS
uniref:Pentatricopeptide repeat-containing protein n=1 Tax=Arundo donax TaxID=35708 RepID=A0A0A8ZIH7_ARUDO